MGLQDGYNFATQVSAYPCADPSPIIWAASFGPAIAPALLDFAAFGCRDILKFRLGIGGPCGRAMKAQVAGAIPPALTQSVGNLMKFEHLFSKFGFYGLIADLASDTAMRWVTLAYTFNGCTLFTGDAHWQLEPTAAHAVLPNRPYELAGNVVNLQGDPLKARSEGALVPPGYYLQSNFTAEAQSLVTGARIGIKTWMRKDDGRIYDYDAIVHAPGYPDQNATSSYMLSNHQPQQNRTAHYIMMGEVTELALIWVREGAFAVTNTPPVNWALSPLSCFRDLTVTRQ